MGFYLEGTDCLVDCELVFQQKQASNPVLDYPSLRQELLLFYY